GLAQAFLQRYERVEWAVIGAWRAQVIVRLHPAQPLVAGGHEVARLSQAHVGPELAARAHPLLVAPPAPVSLGKSILQPCSCLCPLVRAGPGSVLRRVGHVSSGEGRVLGEPARARASGGEGLQKGPGAGESAGAVGSLTRCPKAGVNEP